MSQSCAPPVRYHSQPLGRSLTAFRHPLRSLADCLKCAKGSYLVALSMHTIVAPYVYTWVSAVLWMVQQSVALTWLCRYDLRGATATGIKIYTGHLQTLQESDLRIAATRKGTNGSQNCAMCRKNLLGNLRCCHYVRAGRGSREIYNR